MQYVNLENFFHKMQRREVWNSVRVYGEAERQSRQTLLILYIPQLWYNEVEQILKTHAVPYALFQLVKPQFFTVNFTSLQT